MKSDEIDAAIMQYCKDKKFKETSNHMNISRTISSKNDLEKVFKIYINQIEQISSKLSFSYTCTLPDKQPLLKIQTLKMKEGQNNAKNRHNREKNLEDKCKTKTVEDEIPEDFFILLDELCLKREDAKMFYNNPGQWNYVKSDKKIFCASKGTLFISLWNFLYCLICQVYPARLFLKTSLVIVTVNHIHVLFMTI